MALPNFKAMLDLALVDLLEDKPAGVTAAEIYTGMVRRFGALHAGRLKRALDEHPNLVKVPRTYLYRFRRAPPPPRPPYVAAPPPPLRPPPYFVAPGPPPRPPPYFVARPPPLPPVVSDRMRAHRGNVKYIYVVNRPRTTLAQDVMQAVDDFWNHLPHEMKRAGFYLNVLYDFEGSAAYPTLPTISRAGMVQQLMGLDPGSPALIPPGGGQYRGHDMTRLEDPNTGSLDEPMIRTKGALLGYMQLFLADRESLDELYAVTDGALYCRPNHLALLAMSVRLDQQEEKYGDKGTWTNKWLKMTDGNPGDCVFEAVVDHVTQRQPGKSVYKLLEHKQAVEVTVANLRKCIAVPRGGVSLSQLELLEALEFVGSRNRAVHHRIGFVVFDCRFNLIRLPPPHAKESWNYFIYVCMRNSHFYSFIDLHVGNALKAASLSYYQAVLRVAASHTRRSEDKEETEEERKKVGALKPAEDIFREVQSLGLVPDTDAIDAYLQLKYNLPLVPTAYVHKVHKSVKKSFWEPIPGGRNGELAVWMEGEGADLYYAGKPGRDLYPATWAAAVKSVLSAPDFLKTYSDFQRLSGIGPIINQVVRRAPWGSFREGRLLPTFDKPPPMMVEAKGFHARRMHLLRQNPGRGVTRQEIENCPVVYEDHYEPTLREQWTKVLLDGKAFMITPVKFKKQHHRKKLAQKEMVNMVLEFMERPSVLDKKTVKEVIHDMKDSLCFDLETCSTVQKRGTFLTYAVGWQLQQDKGLTVAQTVEELNGKLLWDALESWVKLAEDLGLKKLYCYAHNGARFDAVACVHEIMARSDVMITNMLTSNGKLISFSWKTLIFRDSMLLSSASLASAAESHGLSCPKLYFPHRYLQDLRDEEEALERLVSKPLWSDLEPYMDWFSGVKDIKELQRRKVGRTWEAWRNEQEIYKDWLAKKDQYFDVAEAIRTYLAVDVKLLWELVQCEGRQSMELYKCDIRQKCTSGSITDVVWVHHLLEPIPKLMSEEHHNIFQKTNRGGFSGPMSDFDFVCAPGTKIYKVDVASLYPASASHIAFETVTGLKEPLKPYYQGFPKADKGWETVDFANVEMGPEHVTPLKALIGTVEIEFDQSHLKHPLLLQKLEYKAWQSLTYVLKSTEYFTIPQILQAFAYGVKIKLKHGLITRESCEPFKAYMDTQSKLKSDCDLRLKQIAEMGGATTSELEREVRTLTYLRTKAKLNLNGMLGKRNQKVDRTQIILTRSFNDVVCMMADRRNYRDVRVEEIGNDVMRVSFKQDGYLQHVGKFTVTPHLSAYMLGYSKMLMGENFQLLSRLGCQMLYTDTDSIVFVATPTQWQAYSNEWIPIIKTFGGMDHENKGHPYHRFVTLGPKKYCGVEEDGSYEFCANGIRASNNTSCDVLAQFEKVLQGQTVQVDHFSITAQTDYSLNHTMTKKNIRFICLKGKVVMNEEDKPKGLTWWKTKEEFEAYAHELKPIPSELQLAKREKALLRKAEAFLTVKQKEEDRQRERWEKKEATALKKKRKNAAETIVAARHGLPKKRTRKEYLAQFNLKPKKSRLTVASPAEN